jgi:hypothetical protein
MRHITRPLKGYDADAVTWGFVWLMFILKIPIVMLLCLVWWAIKSEADPAADEGDGGIRRHPQRPFPRWPKPRKRGPHGAPLPPSPARVRTRAVARMPAAPHR